MQNAGLDEAQAGIKIVERNINNLRHADDTTLMEESKKELKNLLMEVKEEREKAGLKLNIQKAKIMASGPITSMANSETMESDRLYLLELQNDCSLEIKRCLNPGRKPITNLDSILRNRDIIFLTKVRIVKAVAFPRVMYGCERWTIKKAEC